MNTDFSKIYLYRMVHIDNIEHILQYGITHISSVNSNSAYKPIGDGSLIGKRALKELSNSKNLGDYIPFYFGVRMPMLFVVQNGFNGVTATNAEDVVYCVTSVAEIIASNLDFIFTNGHAVNSLTEIYGKSDVDEIESYVDKKAVNCKYWVDENDLDLKRRKEAEFLVEGDIPCERVLGFIVANKTAMEKVNSMQTKPYKKIKILPNCYF